MNATYTQTEGGDGPTPIPLKLYIGVKIYHVFLFHDVYHFYFNLSISML
jgi:hypothetical protein